MNRTKSYAFRCLTAGLFALALSALFSGFGDSDHLSEKKIFEKALHQKEYRLEKEVLALEQKSSTSSLDQIFNDKQAYYSQLYHESGFVLLIYGRDSLKFWSDNSAAVEIQMKSYSLDAQGHLLRLRNGWFEVIRSASSDSGKITMGLLLIKNDFPYQNHYLLNAFQKQFSLPAETRLIKGSSSDRLAIHNHRGDYLFTLKFSEINPPASAFEIWAAPIAIAGLILLLTGLMFFYRQAYFSNKYPALLFILSLTAFRYLMIKFHWPSAIYSTPIFSPQYYGDATSFWLSSFGDLIFDIIFLIFCSIFINFSPTPVKKIKIAPASLLMLAALCSALIVNKLFISLIQNSTITFAITTIFSLDKLSFAGFMVIALVQLAFFLLADWAIKWICSLEFSRQSLILVFLISAGLFSIICHLVGYVDWVFISMPILVCLSVYLIRQRTPPVYSFPDIMLIVVLFSVYSVHTFTGEGRGKERRERMIMAQKLADDQDPLTEHLFSELETKFNSDSLLFSYLYQPGRNTNAFEKRLRQDYFSGYWDKYDLKLSVYDSSCTALLRPARPAADNSAYYDNIIQREGVPTTCEHFYFLKNNSGKISYMAKLPIYVNHHGQRLLATLYAVLNTRFLPEETGFPELLLDRNMGIDRDLFNYSYAKYKNNELISQYGKYQYSLTPGRFSGNKEEFAFFDMDDYTHMSYAPNKSTVVVISKLSHTLLDAVTYFSYLFSFFSLIALISIIVRQALRGRLFNQSSFKYRIQFLLVLIVLVSLALFGTGTILYIKQQYEAKNRESISEKINSVAVDLEGLQQSEDLNNYLLRKLSTVFFTDISLYDLNGNIYASSQPKIFEEGLASKKLNPDAYLQMAINQKTQYIHDEEIGNLDYLSAYVPFKGKNGKLLAYLNLPYFAKQTELEKEISGFLVALINIYVLLFALSVVMAIFISNYVTRPLKLVQDKLSKIQLGKRNEPIEWADQDEIGSLVKEYNRMIEELAHSADLLARSERESAWREMARQVAHEIKNPLTPMKLSVQHLQRMMHDKTPDMEQKLQRITQTLIEQIDALSSIAGAFSSFAQMPGPNNEKTDLDSILQSTISLFKEIDTVKIQYDNQTGHEALVFGDKEQLLRVFNNLLKNAIQAIPEDREGKIEVTLKRENSSYLAIIKDNGTGISKELVGRLFTPNFTTKTTGMGLGLAMAKNSIESCNGKISFKTEEGKGTEFYVSIPIFK